MDYSNYTLFEIIKYKIEFLDFLEYSLISNKIKENDLKKQIDYLNNETQKGMYKEIISTLFTSYKLLNKPITNFLKKYNYKKIENINKKTKIKQLIKYNENIIECYETFKYILNSFTEEEQIIKKLDAKIINLINISDTYFINFLFFNTYNLYLNCVYNNEKNIKHTEKDIIKLIKIFNYCNKENKFDISINTLKNDNETEIYNELEKLSNDCIQLEKQLHTSLNEIINIITLETKKN